MRKYIPVLSIAGSDPSGGAGIQADIKTISALGCYAMTAITSLTAQNTTGVRSIMPSTGAIVADQIDMIMEDIPPMAIKTGMLCNLNVASIVADKLEQYRPDNIVVDPVMVSTSGSKLLDDDAIDLIVKRIFPLSTIITPNKSEAKVLTGETDPDRQAKILMGMGCRNVLLKGGDSDRKDFKIDYLYLENKHTGIELRADAVNTVNTHGTGCTLSSAIASYLALGYDLEQAVRAAKFYISRALEAGAFVTTGRGHGPVNHFYAPRRLKNFNPNRPK
ncbi:bifunctional hydroxymethylpyrimidine kinase/phosphomethylpyrimidine kinase [Duncaniella freteri]|uniref:bifunctional hydroxymethylpyrimidine kinase/phosphomethylpyrimidine kinase n=1 Tax=Duncaniella freteri TaxID=2530391 RepID=UPI002557FE04|nr:bifunctional hydroxymethylpyrimidine kinase/phosphomethylpyrimidine kinase [Duncaniella freteri]